MSQENEVTLETIQELKSKGFTHIEFELKDSGNPYHALVEVVPLKIEELCLDKVRLNSREILDYFGTDSPMTRYVIDGGYLRSGSEVGSRRPEV